MAGLMGSLLTTRRRRIAVPLVALAVAGTGVAGAVALSGGSGSFVVTAVAAPPTLPGGHVEQAVAGLWAGPQVSSWTKLEGPGWLSVDDEGAVVGTAPATAPSQPTVVKVQANGDPGSTIEVVVRVVAPAQQQRLEAASWNLDAASTSAASGAPARRLRALVSEGVHVIGLQETDGTAAKEIATGLGWYYWQASATQGDGDLGLVSAYPISQVTVPTDTVPAAAATVDVNGQQVRVWVTHLDAAEPARSTEAAAVSSAMSADVATASASAATPLLLLGDLSSPSSPPAPFAGLADTYRAAYPDAATHPGTTWDGQRVDYVLAAGPMTTLAAEAYASPGSSWPSDHHAAITVLGLTAPHAASAEALTAPALGAGAHQATASPQATPTPPVPTLLAPRISGRAKVGHTLRARVTIGSPEPRLGFQWYAGKRPIKHATKAWFTVTRAQRGKKITVKVTGALSGYATTSSSSAATKRIR